MVKAKLGISKDFVDESGKLIFPGRGLALLDQVPDLEYETFAESSNTLTREQIDGFDMVVHGGGACPAATVEGNDRLIAVLLTGVGHNRIDLDALTRAGILLCFAPDAVRRPMACTIMTFILTLSNGLLRKDRFTREGRWEDGQFMGEGVTGKTLGSLGVGNIGHDLFRLSQPFAMRHLACDPFVSQQEVDDVGAQMVDMPTLLAESDFLSISVPLSEKTRHLVGEPELRQMKPSAYLINTSRGPLVDEFALIRALEEGWIRGAGLDVFYQEPVDPENPLLKMDNVVLSPHSLCHTDEFFATVWEDKVAQAKEILSGQIPHSIVNAAALDTLEFKTKFARFQH